MACGSSGVLLGLCAPLEVLHGAEALFEGDDVRLSGERDLRSRERGRAVLAPRRLCAHEAREQRACVLQIRAHARQQALLEQRMHSCRCCAVAGHGGSVLLDA
jgi:hypothetical protein